MKILLSDDVIIGTFERLEEMLEFVPTSIFNLRNHLRSRRGGLICGRWKVFYADDYQKESPE